MPLPDVGGQALPALYLSHGAPPLVDDALWVSQLEAVGKALPTPSAILVISAHWEALTPDDRVDHPRDPVDV